MSALLVSSLTVLTFALAYVKVATLATLIAR